MEKATKNRAVRAVPEGFHTVSPFLVVEDAAKLIEFIQKVFDGNLTFIMKNDSNKVVHASLKVGDSPVLVSDVMENMDSHTAMLYLYLEDVDNVFRKAIDAGAESIQSPKDEFYGDRAAAVKDRWGNIWWMATHIEDVDEKELIRRSQQETATQR